MRKAIVHSGKIIRKKSHNQSDVMSVVKDLITLQQSASSYKKTLGRDMNATITDNESNSNNQCENSNFEDLNYLAFTSIVKSEYGKRMRRLKAQNKLSSLRKILQMSGISMTLMTNCLKTFLS